MAMRFAAGLALLLLLASSPGLSGCAHSAASDAPVSAVAAPADDLDGEDEFEDEEYAAGFPDPLERSNRWVFGFNNRLDRFVLEPVTRVYRFLVPGPVRRAVRRVFLNLETPVILVNDLLQLEGRDAGITAARFALNTFFLGGLLDAGTAAGLERHHADFGQTLAIYGVGSGPYLVLPLLGPSNVRDGFGDLVDRLFDPLTYFLGPVPLIYTGATDGFTLREQHSEDLNMLREGSIDYYSSMRNVYYQTRIAEIWSRRPRDSASEAPGSGRPVAVGLELVDLFVDCCDQRVEAFSLDHRGVFGAPQGEFADGSIQKDVDDLPTRFALP